MHIASENLFKLFWTISFVNIPKCIDLLYKPYFLWKIKELCLLNVFITNQLPSQILLWNHLWIVFFSWNFNSWSYNVHIRQPPQPHLPYPDLLFSKLPLLVHLIIKTLLLHFALQLMVKLFFWSDVTHWEYGPFSAFNIVQWYFCMVLKFTQM